MMKHREHQRETVSKRALIAARARQKPQEQFNNLLHHLTYELVEECLGRISRSSAGGVDGMSVVHVRRHLDWLLPPLLEQIHKGSYVPPPVKRVYIPKPKGGERPLGVPTVLDRAIQSGVSQILEGIYEQDFQRSSFGFRRGLSSHHALATVNELVHKRKLNYVLEVDIRDFFGSLNHGWVRRFLGHRITDSRILRLVDSWLKAGVIEDGVWNSTDRGSAQGGSISPLLSNVYLHYVLDLWWERKVRRKLCGPSYLVRYCDDFCLFFKSREDMEEAMVLLRARFSNFGLKLAEEKCHQTYLGHRNRKGVERRAMEFLGFRIIRTRNLKGNWYKTVYCIEAKRYAFAKQKLKDQIRRGMHWDLKSQAKGINRILLGLYNYYGVSGSVDQLGSLHQYVELTWKHCLSHRSNKGHVNWEKMRNILSENRLARPRIRYGYQQLKDLAVL